MKKIVIIIITVIITFLSYLLLGINVEAKEQSSTTEYKDWTELTTLDIDYSYSKIMYNDTTKIQIKKNDGTETWSVVNNINIPFIRLHKGQEAIFIITDCTVNKKGQVLDAVIKINNVNEWTKDSAGVNLNFCGYSKLNSQSNPEGNGGGYDYEIEINRGELVTFALGATKADCDFTITYYVAGTYNYDKKTNTESGIFGGITSVNGYFYDIDINYRVDNVFLNGNEGLVPNVGKSTIYYNKRKYSMSEEYVHLQELDGGIAAKGRNYNCNADWYQNAAYVATTDITNSTYSFKFGGAGCSINYRFMSPYPLTIKQEVSKVRLITADGKTINSIELEDGKGIDELKSAFISDGIFLIVDNEMIQDSRIEIEYKFKVKNNAFTPCTELLIEDYLDEGLTCKSENWEYDGEKVKLHIYGDENNPIIEPDGEYETVMVASRLLSSSAKEYSFRNQALAKVPNVGIESTSETASAQTVNIIPPFGILKKSKGMLAAIGVVIIITFIFKKMYYIVKRKD